MKCTYCKAPVEEGRIFCLKCGEEIVWVPEYNAIGSYRSQSEEAVKEAARRAVENDKIRQALALQALEMEEANKKKKKRKVPWIIVIISILLLGIGGFFGISYYISQTKYNALEYQQHEKERNSDEKLAISPVEIAP